MKYLVALILLAVSFNASALRCRSVLINVGSTLADVEANCDIAEEYHVRNSNVDVVRIVVKEGSIINTIMVIDGVVERIDY